MERSTGQQLKMIPLCDQQPFLLQLGKLHRHGGTLHTEKICQLLTVKGDVKGKGRLPDGFGRQVGQQLFPGGALADMGDLRLPLSLTESPELILAILVVVRLI